VSKSSSDAAIAPALTVFGGWTQADWFSSSVLSDADVVAFELPKLPGTRKQSFRVIDRTQARTPSRKAPQEPVKVPRRPAGKLAALIDGLGAVRAVASCRNRLLFESGPVLFFADIPSARLKPRSANKLRRELMGIEMRACVLRAHADFITLMFWPSADHGITGFVDAALPEHGMHADFEERRDAPVKRAARRQPGRTDRQLEKQDGEREAKLFRQIAALQAQVDALTRAQSALGAMEQLGLDDARLKSMLKLLHPDKHGNSEAANDAAKWLNGMRALLKARVAS
jgi:hypothetical protein